jgi:glyoxylase-like metal-dependent hydrolase (beta-lactamase superfamily II)
MTYSQWPDILPRPGNQKLERVPGADPWFEIYRIDPGTFALLEPRHYEEPISYLILGSERAVLLDTGMGIGNIRAEVERLTALPVIVVNSHGHYDHVGDNHRFAEVWAFDDDGEVARIERGKPHAECAEYVRPGWHLELPAGFDPAAYEIRPSPVTRRLHHLEPIELGGRTLTVHHTPGHSPGSLCLLDGGSHLLFTGDTYYPGMMYADFADSDFDAYRQSIAYLLGLLGPVRHLCPAHNEACVPKERLAEVAAAFERIAAGQVPYQVENGIRVYRLEGFGLTLPLEVAFTTASA